MDSLSSRLLALCESIQQKLKENPPDEVHHEQLRECERQLEEVLGILNGPGTVSQRIEDIRQRDLSQHGQRSELWRKIRSRLFTASELHKLFGSEKACASFVQAKVDLIMGSQHHVTSAALVHGTILETVAKHMYALCVGLQESDISEFGCIVHATHKFIGASPDGIVTKPDSPLYGQLVELKCPFSRSTLNVSSKRHVHFDSVSTPICKAYWVQMQVQLEVMNLPQCDYFECKLQEKKCGLDAFVTMICERVDETKAESERNTQKGVVVVRFRSDIAPFDEISSVYYPDEIQKQELVDVHGSISATVVREKIQAFIDRAVDEKMTPSISFVDTCFYFVEETYFETVERNRTWFTVHCLPRAKHVYHLFENALNNVSEVREDRQQVVKRQRRTKSSSTSTTNHVMEIS